MLKRGRSASISIAAKRTATLPNSISVPTARAELKITDAERHDRASIESKRLTYRRMVKPVTPKQKARWLLQLRRRGKRS